MEQSIIAWLSDYWFWATLGLLLGSALGTCNLVRNGLPFPHAIAVLTIGLYLGAVGARVLFVLIYDPLLLREDFLRSLAFWQGTGTWLGGPLLGPLGIALYLRVLGRPIGSNLGSLAPGLALFHAVARVGCLVSGCCYGRPTDVAWAIFSKQANAMVHPTQIYSMAGELVNLVVLQALWRRPGQRKYLYPLYLLILGIHRFLSEFLRNAADRPQFVLGLSVYQGICILMIVTSVGLMIILRRCGNR